MPKCYEDQIAYQFSEASGCINRDSISSLVSEITGTFIAIMVLTIIIFWIVNTIFSALYHTLMSLVYASQNDHE